CRCTTRAPADLAMSTVRSVLNESKTTISSLHRTEFRQAGRLISSLRVRIKIDIRISRKPDLSFLNEHSRVASDDSPGSDVSVDTRARTDHCTITDRHPRSDKHVSGNPYSVSYHDGCRCQRHGRIGIVMAGCAEIGVLANCRMRSHSNLV